jgi:hypothetical protein
MSLWANVVWANVSWQMSLGKCCMGKCHGTLEREPSLRQWKRVCAMLLSRHLNVFSTSSSSEKTGSGMPERVWVEEWNLKRPEEVPLFKEYEDSFPHKFREKFRMNKETFYKLLDKVARIITKQHRIITATACGKIRIDPNFFTAPLQHSYCNCMQ